jgi:ABC-2 type transport system ATP-binding protein
MSLEIDGLTKRYGATLALDAIRFSVPRGQILGFLGANGAGKTTTMPPASATSSPPRDARTSSN